MAGPKAMAWWRAAKGSGHYPLDFNFIFIRQEKYIQCSYCGMWVHEKRLTRDHVYPKSKGGLIKTPACGPCNEYKEDMLPIEFALNFSKLGRAWATIPIGSDMDDEQQNFAAVA